MEDEELLADAEDGRGSFVDWYDIFDFFVDQRVDLIDEYLFVHAEVEEGANLPSDE